MQIEKHSGYFQWRKQQECIIVDGEFGEKFNPSVRIKISVLCFTQEKYQGQIYMSTAFIQQIPSLWQIHIWDDVQLLSSILWIIFFQYVVLTESRQDLAFV